jgi:hypothetical protein
MDFQATAGQKQELLPGESITIEVIYLARTLGYVDDTLAIQSSSGSFLYHVRKIPF